MLIILGFISCGEEFDKPNLAKATEIVPESNKTLDSLNNGAEIAKPKEVKRAFALVNNLRVRTAADFDSTVIAMLKEGEAVILMGEKSTNTEEVELRGKKYISAFFKVKLDNGKIGWVYGGALDFRKTNSTVTPNF